MRIRSDSYPEETKMKDRGLQYALWPVHPQPFGDELLSSWIIRLAHGNGFKAQTFVYGYFENGKSMWARDVDRTVDTQSMRILAERSGQTIERISAMSIDKYTGKVFEELRSGCHVNWLMPLGIRGRFFRRPGLMFCPACFRDSKEPYLRTNWRMAWSTVCTVHSRLLFDRCPACEATLQPHLADRQYRRKLNRQVSIANCAHCGFDLRLWERFTPVDEEALV
uniref:TniQ domain-containing protein n=1 Tax=Curvibacter symbiont subsp. Hydra magnipapillata TaxID=667019 RepID=C9YBL2_CURXX|nr:hypothetical protein Csp_A15130 [Curvibacter putative symbiont of Hydra magnipapillata]